VEHFLFNFTEGGREQAVALLDARMWGIDLDELHRAALAPGAVALIFVAKPEDVLIGRAELATEFHEWTREEADAYPGDSPGGVRLSDVERWEPAVPMATVVNRIDPTGSSRLVQTNAAIGFPRGLVRIDPDEYEAALALSRETRGT
jgi:hypothetical protein